MTHPMKKIYITPNSKLHQLIGHALIADSLTKYDDGGGSQLVKGDPTTDYGTGLRYNVWDDDWSK